MADLTGTLCRCWRVTRKDGRVFAFTDHDDTILLDGTTFRPSDALSARALEQSTGLSVDNSEAVGALSDDGLTEEDILAGRFDGADVEIWEIDWSYTEARRELFQGELGEIERAGGAFKAELRGLTQALNRPIGRLYQKQCSARFCDSACGLDPASYTVETVVGGTEGAVVFVPESDAPDRWFAFGTMTVLDGAGAGILVQVRGDQGEDGLRRLTLWDGIRGLAPGDRVRLLAGCDKRAATCRDRFANMINFRGCPHLPSEDWVTAFPAGGTA